MDIEDNPFDDILLALEGICVWVDNALASSPNVLVHCVQGISRSGAVIVAYLMRQQAIDYESALELARESRAMIMPNSGFVDQLRLWHAMGYSIYDNDEKMVEASPTIKLKYLEWKDNRGILLSKAEQAKQEALMKSMSDLVARFGERRMKLGDGNLEESV